MKMTQRMVLVAGLAFAVAVPAAAQLGTPVGTPIDAQAYIGQTGCLGVEYAWGHYWVSARTLVAGQPHTIGKFDVSGTGLAQFPQAAVYGAAAIPPLETPWGGRDGASDEAGNKLYFGHEGATLAIYNYNPGTGTLDPGTLVQIPGIPGTIRALARRPSDGHFFTADFGGNIYEFVLTPTPAVVNSFPNNANGGLSLAYYGMAWDSINNTLWGWSQNRPPTQPTTQLNQLVKATELNPSNMSATGREFYGQIWPVGQPETTNNIAGGADIACNLPFNPGKNTFVGFHQTTSDSILFYDMADSCGGAPPCYANCDGSTVAPILNVSDFICFQTKYAGGDPYANCDGSTTPPILNVSDFICFQTKYAAGCS